VAGRAPRTRFTDAMDSVIRARLGRASGQAHRGEVRRAVGEVAAQLGVPAGAVLKRWYRIRDTRAPGPADRNPPGGDDRPGELPALLAAYLQALAQAAARRAELARAEAELSEAASRLALRLLERRGASAG
jgi:hypothetical protein